MKTGRQIFVDFDTKHDQRHCSRDQGPFKMLAAKISLQPGWQLAGFGNDVGTAALCWKRWH
jgi:hypothetical protein